MKTPDYLLLVNAEHQMPEEFPKTVELVWTESAMGNKIQVEKQTYAAFLRMKEDLWKEDGIEAGLSNSYRTIEKQEEIYTRYTREFGPAYAAKYAAKPGHSEHHTGLAIDVGIVQDGKFYHTIEELLSVDHLFQVIHQKLPRYGFLLRYPGGKESVTGIGYEPWHFRYIDSSDIAKEITDQGLCLEEYLVRNDGSPKNEGLADVF